MTALLQHFLTAQAEKRPEAVALVMNQERMTFGQWEEQSNRLARLLREAGCRKGDRVGLLVPKSPAALVGMLGCVKADCIYVPLCTANPAARLAKILESAEPRLLLAADPVAPLLEELMAREEVRRAVSVGWLEGENIRGENFQVAFSLRDLAAVAAGPLESANSPQDPLYLMYTSGSTGTPKGVLITQANVLHFIQWATRYFGMNASDRISGHSPLHFDLSAFDIYGALASGAELHLIPPELNLLPHKLAELIRAAGLTQWFSAPSVLSYMARFDVVRPDDFPALKRVIWCGEVFPTPGLLYWMKRLPRVAFTNLYGPTEATIASSYYTVPACPAEESAAIPIGTGCAGEELLVLDAELRRVPPGEVGDLYIRGVGLSPGYWGDPEKTRALFLPHPHSADPHDRIYKTGDLAKLGPDGLVYFVGRADTQIKSRGYRIELGEIEAALNALPYVRECAVVALPSSGFEGATVCSAYVCANGSRVTPAAVRGDLSRALPSYMLPSRWLALETLPKNSNGKIDRPRLKEMFHQHGTQAH